MRILFIAGLLAGPAGMLLAAGLWWNGQPENRPFLRHGFLVFSPDPGRGMGFGAYYRDRQSPAMGSSLGATCLEARDEDLNAALDAVVILARPANKSCFPDQPEFRYLPSRWASGPTPGWEEMSGKPIESFVPLAVLLDAEHQIWIAGNAATPGHGALRRYSTSGDLTGDFLGGYSMSESDATHQHRSGFFPLRQPHWTAPDR